jgi:hypothetical protein
MPAFPLCPSRLPLVVQRCNCRSKSSSSVSDALYSEGSFVDKFTWHAESSVPPINARTSFSTLDTRTSAFEAESQTDKRDEQIRCWVSSSIWLRASDEIISYRKSLFSLIMADLTTKSDASPNNESDKYSLKSDVSRYEVVDGDQKPYKNVVAGESSLDDPQNDIFAEALARYPNDECIDTRDENKVRRKLDFRILPVLGVCYFFYYVDKTTLFVISRLPS